MGLAGRGSGTAAEAGRSTFTSTVASGAATMKMISNTNITSMNGVTLMSWASSSSSEPRSRLIRLLRSGAQQDRPRRRTIQIARRQRQHRRGEVTQQQPVSRDDASKDVVDDHC